MDDETIKWVTMENDIASERHCMLGDGHTDYEEWFEYCDLSEEDLKKYKEWLGYEDNTIEQD